MNEQDFGRILIYQNEKGDTKIDVYFEGDTVWLTQKSLAELYQVKTNTINEHIKNILEDGELEEAATIRSFRIVQNEGVRQVNREIIHYNFEMILAIGYRVRSNIGVQKDMRRIQIRETIISHFEKEKRLFELGIKTLSLFFIDEVAKYRVYNEAGEEVNSEYGDMFEQEYIRILNDYITLENTPYIRYLKSIEPNATHAGYFSIDKHGHKVDSATKRGSDESDDISAYDLILKKKERLLSFDEPVRFIFSHSALREGWDNPNVFQICTLKHGGISPTQKRQEVGRGLRLCVNQSGERMDSEKCGDSVHSLNMLTVIASEGYKNFVADLQTGIKEALYDRPSKATQEYFTGKTIMVEEQRIVLDVKQAKDIYRYLARNYYIDDNDNVSETYRSDLENNCLAPLPEALVPLGEGVHMLVQSVFDQSVLDR